MVEEHLTTEAHYMFVTFNLHSSFEVVNMRDRNNIYISKSVYYSLVRYGRAYVINLFAGLISLRIGIKGSLIFMCFVVSIKLSKICLLGKKMQKRLFDIRETNLMFFGRIILPIARIYSI
jgi:hypothetical protein